MLKWLILATLCCAPLHAAFGDFPRRAARPPLFGESVRVPHAQKPQPKAPAPPPETGHVGLAFWVDPYLRIAAAPDGEAAGAGFEFSYLFGQTFGITAGVAGYAGEVDVPAGHDDSSKSFGGLEVELGFRMRMLRWDGGALYLDARAAYASYTGGSALRTTHSVGGGARFGWEFGGPVIRGFIEGGLDLRVGLNWRDSGWLRNGSSNGAVGVFFDVARIGLRVYL